MSRSRSYTKIPISDTHDEEDSLPTALESGSSIPVMLASLPRLPSSASGYSKIETEDYDDAEEDKENAVLRPLSDSDSVHTTVDRPIEGTSSSPAATSTTESREASGEAQTSRPQFPAAANARRMIQQTMDGVFSNLSAKPRIEQPRQEELPPPYKAAALDQSPIYYETTVMENGLSGDQVLVDGLPVGKFLGLCWTLLLSMSFQFLGFFLTYLLHTSHATKAGSKLGLGMTFISIGQQMLSGDSDEPDIDSDTGYMGNVGETPKSKEYVWASYLMLFLGIAIILHSGYEFVRVKRTETAILAASVRQSEEMEISTLPATQSSMV